MSPTTLDWKRQIKRALDPGNVFGAANQDPDLP
jgi:hypothetical protein